jgi:hypothetical protein
MSRTLAEQKRMKVLQLMIEEAEDEDPEDFNPGMIADVPSFVGLRLKTTCSWLRCADTTLQKFTCRTCLNGHSCNPCSMEAIGSEESKKVSSDYALCYYCASDVQKGASKTAFWERKSMRLGIEAKKPKGREVQHEAR